MSTMENETPSGSAPNMRINIVMTPQPTAKNDAALEIDGAGNIVRRRENGAQQQAAGKQDPAKHRAPRHQRNQCRRSQVTHRNHWTDDLSGNQINRRQQRHRAARLAQAAAPYAGKHIQVARAGPFAPAPTSSSGVAVVIGIGAAQVVCAGRPRCSFGKGMNSSE